MYELDRPVQARMDMVAAIIKEAKKSRAALKRERMSAVRNSKVEMPKPAPTRTSRSGATNPAAPAPAPAPRSGATNPPAPKASPHTMKDVTSTAKSTTSAAPKQSKAVASTRKLFSGRNLRRAGKVGLGLGALGGLAYGAHRLTTKTAAFFDELDKIAQAQAEW